MYNLRHIPTTILWCLIILLLVSCVKKPATNTHAERKTLDSIIASSHNIDTLSMLQKRMESEGNMLGSIIAYREIGKHLRNESRFDEALEAHSEGLTQAEAIGDTLEMVQALNNIGTDYRRMGVLDMAQDYHYRAYAICKASTDSSFTARKNRVVSLNGLGNIYLTLGNFARADSALRLALAGERELNSLLGTSHKLRQHRLRVPPKRNDGFGFCLLPQVDGTEPADKQPTRHLALSYILRRTVRKEQQLQ